MKFEQIPIGSKFQINVTWDDTIWLKIKPFIIYGEMNDEILNAVSLNSFEAQEFYSSTYLIIVE